MYSIGAAWAPTLDWEVRLKDYISLYPTRRRPFRGTHLPKQFTRCIAAKAIIADTILFTWRIINPDLCITDRTPHADWAMCDLCHHVAKFAGPDPPPKFFFNSQINAAANIALKLAIAQPP